nr:alpha/beta fold hydrolase [uncultured Rhodoferax sp.]
MQLLCFPCAGAGASMYAPWRKSSPAGLDIRPVELPGRGSRMGEPFALRLDDLVDQLALELHDQVCRPYALFGHSLGGLVAYALAHALVGMGVAAPVALCISGTAAPGWRDVQRYRALREPAQLKEELRHLNGMPAELLDNQELMDLVLPVLAADFRLCADWTDVARRPLACPIHVFGGKGDPRVSEAALAAWQQQTEGHFSLDMFDGDHFYLRQHQSALLQRLQDCALHRVAESA